MIHLTGLIAAIPDKSAAGLSTQNLNGSEFYRDSPYRWNDSRDGAVLSVFGDSNVEPYVSASPECTLVCNADLLGSKEGQDFHEANTAPAAYLARRYRQYGDSFARDLRGSFSILLFDHQQQAIKAWSDHFGIRRLYYKQGARGFAVASDLRLLNLLTNEAPEVDPGAVHEYLLYTCIPAPRTIYKNTSRLRPGHWIDSRTPERSKAYWDMDYEERRGWDQKTWEDRTFEAIEAAVGLASRTAESNQKIGCYLSGGTDSSSVSGLVQRFTGLPPCTVSIGFEDPRYNEIEYARIAATHFQTDHHEYFVTPGDIVALLQKACKVYDEPFGNSSIIPAYYCARTGAEQGVTHMLAGDGGDELFGGNQRYANDRLFQRYHLLPEPIRAKILEPLLAFANSRLHLPPIDLGQRYVRRANIPPPDRYLSYDLITSVTPDQIFSDFFRSRLGASDPIQPARDHFHAAKTDNDLNRWLYLDIKITITDNDIRKVTAMAEMAGIQPRYPLLDPGLADFSATIPHNLKVKGTSLRFLFKQAMKRLLPQQILTKKKHGFGLPFSAWLGENRELHDFVFDIMGSRAARERGYFRSDFIEWIWARYQSEHKTYYGDVLWIFLMLELWHLSQNSAVEVSK